MNIVSNSSAFANGSTVAIATSNDLSTLVVFDGRLEDLATLYGALLPGVAGFTIDPAADALVEITRLLAETGAKSLSIVAHGEPGVVHLGRESIDLAVLGARSGLLQEWCVDEISLYSCEVAKNKVGDDFVAQLSAVTGAFVAASATKMGCAEMGGNWDLAVTTARMKPILVFQPSLLERYSATLSLGVVAVFDNPTIVDTSGGRGAESDTMQASLAAQGYTVTTFTGTSAAEINTALSGVSVLVIPEQERGSLINALDVSAKSAIASFVSSGGQLIINGSGGSSSSLINGIFGFSTTEVYSSGSFSKTSDATGTPFADDPSTILDNSATTALSSLPAGSKSIYTNATGAAVALIPFGSGQIKFLGWDWFDAAPLGTTDAGWLQVLGSILIPTPTVTAPSAFTVTEDVAGNLAFVGTPFADIDSSSLTVTLSIADGSIAALAGTGITLDGTASARTFSGTIADLNTYFTTAGNVSYTTAQDNNIARTLNISVSDGVYSSSTTSTINITAVNDYAPAPVLTSVSLAAIAEDAVLPTGATVNSLFGSAFSDADGAGIDGSFFGIAITGNTSLPDQGTWEWLDGTEWTEITGVATTGALVLDKNTLIRFSPAADYNGTPGALTARLIDSSTTLVSGTGGHAVNGAVGVNSGGATAISRNAVTLTTSVTAVNDAPTLTVNLSPAANAQNYTEGGATSNGLFVNAQANTHILGNNTEAEQKFQSVTLEVSNLFAGDQLRIDGALVNIDTTTTSIVAGTFAVDVTVADGISQVTISRPGLDISNANLQTVIEGIGFNSTSDNPTDFGNKNTRDIKIVNIKDNGGIPDSDSTALSLLGTITIHDVNDVAALTDDSGAAAEGSMPINATGNVLSNDIDLDNTLYVSSVNGTSTEASASFIGNYGTLNIGYNGAYTYVVDNDNTLVNSLNVGSESLVDSFSYTVYEGGTSHTATLKIDIAGGNNLAKITGDIDRLIDESATVLTGTTTTGTLISTDVDNTSYWMASSGETTYGSYELDSLGAWNYTLENGNTLVDALNIDASLVDTFSVTTVDGTSQTVSVTINGQNDAAIITGDVAGSIAESGTIPAGNSVTGTLVSTDVDNTSNWAATSSAATYGSYGLDSLGAWTYTLENGNTLVDALNIDASLVDTFTVTTVDGTSQIVSVTINGADDASVLSDASTFTGSLTEASGLNNSIHNDLASSQATGQVIYTDVDDTIVWNTSTKQITTSQQGSYSVDADGNWVYNLNNNYGTVQKLHAGQSTTDTFTISTTSGLTQTVTVVIQGGEDTPVVINPAALSGSVTEAGGEDPDDDDRRFFGDEESSYIPGIRTVSKDVNFKDPDNTSDVWTSDENYASYGSYSVNTAGKWTYDLDNYSRAVQSLNDGQTLTDTFEIATNDGTSKTVAITINGTNDAAYIYNGYDYHSVEEAGGVANGFAGMPTTTGDLDNFDVDNTPDSWTVQESVVSIGGYGTYSINASGEWTYSLDNTNPDVEALTGEWWNDSSYLSDTFVVQTIDGTSHTVTVSINGRNDDAVITGDINKSIAEASGFDNSVGSSVLTGALAYTDVDNNPADGWQAESDVFTGQYGTYDITSTGEWTYTLNNNNGDVDGLQDGETLTDSFTVYTVAGTSQTVNVTINGANDSAVITGLTTAEFTEDDEVTSTIGNNLNYTDPDNIEDGWQAVGTPALSDGEYGNYTINADGVWSYSLNDAKVQTIGGGETVIDTFTATTTDGTSQTVTITINGANDAAVLSSDVVSLDEADAALTAGGTLTISDVDNSATFEVLTDVAGDNGSFSIDATGAWTYTANSAFDSLNVEDSIADVFTVTAADGTTSSVTVTINGTNDPTTITGDTTGIVTEDTSINFFGSLVATDVDDSGALFTPVTNQSGANNYGKFTISDNGAWQYDLDNDNPLVQHLGAANSLTDTYTFNTITGASQTVSVTINGSIDAGVSITGTSADETINGKDGNDVLDGAGDSTGLDTFAGGAGNDVYGVYNSGTIIIENAGEGIDGVWTAVDYILPENVESLYLVGNTNGTGNDGDNIISGYAVGNNVINGGAGFDVLYGGEGSDYLIGGLGSDYLDGGTDDDILDGAGDSAGLDTFAGGAGNDVYGVYNSGTIIIENAGEGIDGVWTAVDYILPENVESLYLVGDIAGTGNVGDNIISGYALGNNTINGDGGNDVLSGGEGNDTIDGGAGTDIISGGTGIDIFSFLFTQSTSTATDHITDFEIGVDKLDIFTPAGVAATPNSFSRSLDDSTSVDLSSLATGVYTNGLVAGGAALVVSTGAIAGTYVVIDDGIAGFNGANDLVINITGYNGALPTNPTSVSSFFKV